MRYFKIKSPLGTLVACMADDVLKGLWFENQRYFPDLPEDLVWGQPDEALVQAMDGYFKGEREVFHIECQPEGTDFQKMVWDVLQTIPYGTTISYKEVSRTIAQRMGRTSMSAQAVGSAIGRNPISLVIPCHRVVGSNGQLTGYAGGLDKKVALLRLEGALL